LSAEQAVGHGFVCSLFDVENFDLEAFFAREEGGWVGGGGGGGGGNHTPTTLTAAVLLLPTLSSTTFSLSHDKILLLFIA